jgi:hypothetical protein
MYAYKEIGKKIFLKFLIEKKLITFACEYE